MKPGYDPSVWREFIKRHDDIETYNIIKCQNCHNERPYCFCNYPRFQNVSGIEERE